MAPPEGGSLRGRRLWWPLAVSFSLAVLSSCVAAAASSRGGDPLAGVQDLILEGRYEEARNAARVAQRAFRQRGDRHLEALASLVLAMAEVQAKNFATAAVEFERAAASLESHGDRYSTWMALWPLVLLKLAQRQPEEALALHQRSLALLREIESSAEPFSAEGLRYLGRLLQLSPNLLRWLSTRPEDVKPILLRIAEAISRNAAVTVLLHAGRLDDAEVEIAALTALPPQLEGMFAEEAAIHLGDLRRRQWRLDEAREIFRQALDRTNPFPAKEKELLERLTELEIVSGRFDEALAWNERALALARRSGQPEDEASVLMFRAYILWKTSGIEAAEKTFGEALALAREAGADHLAAAIHHQLGQLALSAELPDKAAASFETAARLFRSANLSYEEAQSWIQLALIYLFQFQSRGSAEVALERARELSRQIGAHEIEAWIELAEALKQTNRRGMNQAKKSLLMLLALPEMRGIVRQEDGQTVRALFAEISQVRAGKAAPPAARASDAGSGAVSSLRGFTGFIRGFAQYQHGHYAAARALWLATLEATPRQETKSILLTYIGYSHARERNDREAIRYLTQAMAAVEQSVEDIRLEELLASYLGSDNKTVLFADLIDLLVRNRQIEDAFDTAERARARAFLQGLGNRRIQVTQGADAQLAREAEELRKRILALERRAIALSGAQDQLAADLQEARERYQSLRLRLKVTNPLTASPPRVTPLQLAAVREELAPDTTLISYFVTPSQVHAWVLDKETFQHVLLRLRPSGLRRAVCWAESLGRQGGRGARPVNPSCGGQIPRSEWLYKRLFAPLQRYIHHRRLIVIPHGELHAIPFAALRNPKTGRHLLEDYTLTYAPSASVLGVLRAKETPLDGKALVLGAPKELDPTLPDLTAAQQEAKVVGRLFGTRPRLGSKATESQLHQIAGEVDLLHIAAHGIFEPRSPQFSRIALAPGKGHDGNLEVHEIYSDLDLSGVNLVVLSACETARGERSGGDEITGLARAFLAAGSPAVISTLWNIDDAASAVLMESFYRRLLTGASVAEALRQAQLDLLRIPRYSDPYYWAAFALTGDPDGTWKPQGPSHQ